MEDTQEDAPIHEQVLNKYIMKTVIDKSIGCLSYYASFPRTLLSENLELPGFISAITTLLCHYITRLIQQKIFSNYQYEGL